jgi:hypothetical protein
MYLDLLCYKGSYWDTCRRFSLFSNSGVAYNHLSTRDDPNHVDGNATDLDINGSRIIQNFVIIHFSCFKQDRKEKRLVIAHFDIAILVEDILHGRQHKIYCMPLYCRSITSIE